MAEGMSEKGLNVNAKAFVPNVNAATFVPEKKIHQEDTRPVVEQQKSAEELVVNGVNAVTEQLSSMAGPSPPVPKTDATSDQWDQGAEEEQNGESEPAATQQQSSKRKKQSPTPEPESLDRKEYVSVVFIGHVVPESPPSPDTLSILTGMVDKRKIDKYSEVLDTNQEEQERGKTVEVGRAYFETEKKHFTVLDAPGHKSFVPNMISGASQADLAVLVISARKGEFEAGFERGGQTLEHALLVKTVGGVKHLVILVNKMDDPTVEWDRSRFEEIKERIGPDLKKKCGFNPKTDIYYIPCSGLTGAFLSQRSDAPECSWYTGPCFIEYIDSMPPIRTTGLADHALKVVLVGKYNDMGMVALGKGRKELLSLPNPKQPEEKPKSIRYVKQGQVCRMILESSEVFCLEAYKHFPKMGRFALRDEGKTIAIGKVLEVMIE